MKKTHDSGNDHKGFVLEFLCYLAFHFRRGPGVIHLIDRIPSPDFFKPGPGQFYDFQLKKIPTSVVFVKPYRPGETVLLHLEKRRMKKQIFFRSQAFAGEKWNFPASKHGKIKKKKKR